jgi:hypothetical protein
MHRLEEKWASRRRADVASVKALADVLRNIVAHPADFLNQQGLQSVLHSQGNLAKYAIPDLSVRPMSLNHQRRMADMALGGYQYLDDLRRAALDALNAERQRTKRGNKKTKDGLAVRVKELEFQIALLKRDLALLQLAYDRRCVQARNYAPKSKGN